VNATVSDKRALNRSCRIAVADDDSGMRQYFQEILPALGHQLVAVAENGRQLVENCKTCSPDLVITDIRMPDTDGFDAVAHLCREQQVPVVVLSGYHNADYLDRAYKTHLTMAYLLKPVKAPALQNAILLALSRFELYQKVIHEVADLHQALENRKAIERAKGVLMRRMRLDEAEAFRRLRQRASDTNSHLVEIARGVLHAEEAFEALERSAPAMAQRISSA
jgi:response regulator NasT